jgi:phage terminase large subunit
MHYQSSNFKKEQGSYSWQKKGDDWINKPEDKNNHCFDAARYAFMYLKSPTLKQRKGRGRRRMIIT